MSDQEYAQIMEEQDINNARHWEEENEPVQALEQFERGYSKSQISVMASTVVASALENGNVLQMAEGLSAMETFIKEVKADKRFIDHVREEAGKTPKGYVSNSGAKIELSETGTKYFFDKCNDPVLGGLYAKIAALEIQVKERETFLKTIPPAGLDIRHEDELVTIYPPYKTSISSYKVTLSK